MKQTLAYLQVCQDEAIHHESNEQRHFYFSQNILEIISYYRPHIVRVTTVSADVYEVADRNLQHSGRSVNPCNSDNYQTTNGHSEEKDNRLLQPSDLYAIEQ